MARAYRRDSKGRFASGGGGGRKKSSGKTPKTTSARGRAQTVERRASKALKAGAGTKAAKSLYTAQRARDYYKVTGTGKKRSATKAKTKVSVAERKKALTARVSRNVLLGKPESAAAKRYVQAQQTARTKRYGKGSKAKRRMRR